MSNTKRRRTTEKPRRAPAQPAADAGIDWKKYGMYAVGGVAIVALIAAIVLNQPESLDPPEGVESFVVTDRDHLAGPIAYPQDPPAGGAHNPVWQECGFYPQPINSENAVHALEHGAVWITFQPDLDQDTIDRLARLARDPEILVSPYPGLDSPVVASTWGNQLRFSSADDPDIEAFIQNFKNAPGTPEPNAGCNDGRGTTALRGQGL